MFDYNGLTGEVIYPYNSKYDVLRRDYNLYYNYFPRVIVYANNSVDVVNAVNWARKNNVNIRSRCGGHSYNAFSTANASLVLDVSNLTKFNLDKKNNLVTIGSGFRLGDLYTLLANEGYQFTGGSCFNVGITGLMTGGGFGYSSRKYGLCSDNLVQLKMISALGKEIIANDFQNSDLFWACRGAGQNNFGVFTEFTFRVYPVSKVTVIGIEWTKEKRLQVMETYQAITKNLFNEITLHLVVSKNKCIVEGISYAPLESTKKEIQSLLDINCKITENIKYVPFIEAATILGDGGEPGYSKKSGSFAFNLFPREAFEIVLSYFEKLPSNFEDAVFELLQLGAAVKENKNYNTSFAYRDAIFIVQYETALTNPSAANELICWLESFRNAMLPYACRGYINYQDICIKNYLESYYGRNVSILQCVKNKYNPTNLFDYPQGLL